MKKLIIAAARVCAAAVSQAAVVTWGLSSGAITFNGTKLGNQAVQLYIVGVSGAADLLVDTRNTANSPAANKGKLANGSGSGQASYDYNSTIAGGDVWSSESGDLARQYYIVLTYNDGVKDYTYTSSAVASSGLSDTKPGTVAFTFNDTIKTSGTDGWVASSPVPEPTSGLLLLLGVAGLALRRKQK